ncbi:MAG: hypothetical protein OXG39_08255 [Chloroflexi bacterium]|nr:hypothetical protein [Chloroflexota bacterium]
MSILGLTISLALFLLAIAAVAHPFLRRRKTSEHDDAQLQVQRDRVQVYYERVLTNIRDLDEDYATGKINEDDYREEREVWARRGMRLLRVRDSLDARQSLVKGGDANADKIDEAIEAAISAYREGAGAVTRTREAN